MSQAIEKIITNPVKAIRAKCLDCCAGQTAEVQNCPIETCPLYPFRKGSNPHRKKKELSQERREEFLIRIQKAREARAFQKSLFEKDSE